VKQGRTALWKIVRRSSSAVGFGISAFPNGSVFAGRKGKTSRPGANRDSEVVCSQGDYTQRALVNVLTTFVRTDS